MFFGYYNGQSRANGINSKIFNMFLDNCKILELIYELIRGIVSYNALLCLIIFLGAPYAVTYKEVQSKFDNYANIRFE